MRTGFNHSCALVSQAQSPLGHFSLLTRPIPPRKPLKVAAQQIRLGAADKPTAKRLAQSGPYDLLAVGLGTLLAALLLCRVINGLQAPANGYAGGTLDMQAIVSGVFTFDSA
jgi:hypothetical protein